MKREDLYFTDNCPTCNILLIPEEDLYGKISFNCPKHYQYDKINDVSAHVRLFSDEYNLGVISFTHSIHIFDGSFKIDQILKNFKNIDKILENSKSIPDFFSKIKKFVILQ